MLPGASRCSGWIITFPVSIWPQQPSLHRLYNFTNASDGTPRDPTSVASKLAMCSDMDALRNRFSVDRFENWTTRCSPSDFGSVLVDPDLKRGGCDF